MSSTTGARGHIPASVYMHAMYFQCSNSSKRYTEGATMRKRAKLRRSKPRLRRAHDRKKSPEEARAEFSPVDNVSKVKDPFLLSLASVQSPISPCKKRNPRGENKGLPQQECTNVIRIIDFMQIFTFLARKSMPAGRRGMALFTVLVSLVIFALFTAAIGELAIERMRGSSRSILQQRATYAAEAGFVEATEYLEGQMQYGSPDGNHVQIGA